MMEVVYSNLISLIKSMITWNSCSAKVEETFKGLYAMEMYQPELREINSQSWYVSFKWLSIVCIVEVFF